jgi:[protein-PII] uridylyltransferase
MISHSKPTVPQKEEFDRSLGVITQLHRRGAGGLEVGLALTQRLDTLIRHVHDEVVNPQKERITIVALGGYGRKELCFYSDTDIMLLIDRDAQRMEAAPVVQRILHQLLDYGLDVGHSFRTVEECSSLFGSDFKSWNSLLESRYVCGDPSTFSRLRSSMAAHIRGDKTREYLQKLIASMESRHQEYGTSAKLLEPNIKNSAGGLRDLHASLWLMIGSGSFPSNLEQS